MRRLEQIDKVGKFQTWYIFSDLSYIEVDRILSSRTRLNLIRQLALRLTSDLVVRRARGSEQDRE